MDDLAKKKRQENQKKTPKPQPIRTFELGCCALRTP